MKVNIVSWNVRGLNDPRKRFPSEKKNCIRITKAMEDFLDFIEGMELEDPPLIGGSFTWRK
ncbi:hypothetical protein H5410_022325 [Solanum commersonii]|uniref:Uncharacterized protein n=1 Tax=Solanum commersonii TaxID=4109 RepID=A0A9J5ZHQ1_SOLCO|nr:hypothetical protein H5410_022325 [Solanum commersonii]